MSTRERCWLQSTLHFGHRRVYVVHWGKEYPSSTSISMSQDYWRTIGVSFYGRQAITVAVPSLLCESGDDRRLSNGKDPEKRLEFLNWFKRNSLGLARKETVWIDWNVAEIDGSLLFRWTMGMSLMLQCRTFWSIKWLMSRYSATSALDRFAGFQAFEMYALKRKWDDAICSGRLSGKQLAHSYICLKVRFRFQWPMIQWAVHVVVTVLKIFE